MNNKEILMVILYIIELAIICIFYNLWNHEKRKRIKEKDYYLNLSLEYCDRIEELNNELKTYKDWESVVHVEKFVIDPLVFNVKLGIDRDVFNNVDSLKSFCLNQTARHISEALKKNDNLYQLMYERNAMLCRDNVIIRVRLTPFKEDADWSKLPTFTKINDICQYKPLEDCNPATDFSVL
jgi:hypothetical protein